MATGYDPKSIEQKWQKVWEEQGVYSAKDASKDPKFYGLIEFPYPSGDGLHVGHPRSYTAIDIVTRKKRMEGKNVLYPIGWDAFGLPTENYAIKHKIKPQDATAKNIATFTRQLKSLGFGFDWDREVNTTDPKYFKWTQWMFLQFFKQDLAYKTKTLINWCPKDKIGLANEEVVAGCCERCGTPVEKREKEQWMIAITKYADRLLSDLDTVDYLPQIKKQQQDWIGKKEGAEITFPVSLPSYTGDIVFASNNQGKLNRMQKLFKRAGLKINVKSPADIGVTDFDVVEDCKTLAENSEKKARALAEKTNLPVIADDTGFFIDQSEIDPVTVKRNALNGRDEKSLSVEEIGKLMAVYYQEIASKHGGSVDAEWRDALCLITPEKFVLHAEAVRPVTLTNELHGESVPSLPLRSLYISKATGKYVLEQTEKEELKELQPITDAIKKLFSPALTVFTTRPDTMFGATFLVVSPEVAKTWIDAGWKASKDVVSYVEQALKRDEMTRTNEEKEKTGVTTGVEAVNPANGEKIPVWVADYVLGNYGTGAIMAVPAHDERDFAFAKKFNLKMKRVVILDQATWKKNIFEQRVELEKWLYDAHLHTPETQREWQNKLDAGYAEYKNLEKIKEVDVCFEDEGTVVNSDSLDDLSSDFAKERMIQWLEKKRVGKRAFAYKLRDWVFSRQRYWGEPIPIIRCPKDGYVPVPDDQLPVKLPDVEAYEPTDTGESPLAKIREWVEVECPKCGGKAERETDTMPNWAGSSWYFLRYCDPKNDKEFASAKKLKYWMPVDLYNGGMEHTTLHLLYSRFWYKFLWDIGAVPKECGSEPYRARRSHGLILAEGGEKMSKSKGNVVNPDDIVATYGADVFRVYEMFMGPFDQPVPWDTNGIEGVRRFLEKVWKLFFVVPAEAGNQPGRSGLDSRLRGNDMSQDTEILLHQTIKKVTEDIEALHFNTAVSSLMILTNGLLESGATSETLEIFLKLLAPFAPHMTEELWHELGHKTSIHREAWPSHDPAKIVADTFEMVVQVNGKVRDRMVVATDISEEDAKKAALASEKVQGYIGDVKPTKIVYVKGRLVSISF